VIGDLKNTDLIDILTRNEHMKEAMLQEIEDLQDKSKQLDEDLVRQDKEIEQIDNFISSENGMNQQKVSDLENQLKIGEENIEHLQEVIKQLKVKTDENEVELIHRDNDLIKKTEDFHELNIKLVDSEQEVKVLSK
jgi:uncharacterized protein (DUF3084 family)